MFYTIKDNSNWTTIGNIKNGECFRHMNCIYLRLHNSKYLNTDVDNKNREPENKCCYCLNLSLDIVTELNLSINVEKVKAKLEFIIY